MKEMNKEQIDLYAGSITDHIYSAYASGTGILFGLPSNQRNIAELIVRLTIETIQEDEKVGRI